mgnify:CR=1 FL=1
MTAAQPRAWTAGPKSPKPLGMKAYGSIPHLPNSRMGPADHHCHPGQEVICTVKARDKHDRIIVMEKLDGGCVSVANVGGEIVGLIRAGYTAADAHYEHLRLFGEWVNENTAAFAHLEPGQRLVGEWMALAHGTRYAALPSVPFVVFDAFTGKIRMPLDTVRELAAKAGLDSVAILSDGPALPVADALARMGGGAYGAEGGPEGVVYRVERKGEVDFLAKYVRPDKVDGCFLPEVGGCPPQWHWHSDAALAKATTQE